jgi:hypothetical protein
LTDANQNKQKKNKKKTSTPQTIAGAHGSPSATRIKAHVQRHEATIPGTLTEHNTRDGGNGLGNGLVEEFRIF